jgi:hypothetical protein
LSIEIISPDNDLLPPCYTTNIDILQLMLFYSHTLCTSPECLHQLLRVLALSKLFLEVASDNRLFVVAHLLFSDSLLELLDLVKTADQILFIVPFNIVCNCFHIVVDVVNLAPVELVLDIVG